MRRLPITFVLVIATTVATPALASTITHSSSMSGSGSASRTTTGTTSSFISFTPLFQKFDPTLGVLTAAELEWTFTGTMQLTESQFAGQFAFNTGNLAFTYAGSSHVVSYDTDISQTITFTGPTSSASLALAPVTGLGTFDDGPFKADYTVTMGTFPASVSGEVTGTFLLTYTYISPNEREPDPTPMPEPTTALLLGAGLAGIRKLRSRRRASLA